MPGEVHVWRIPAADKPSARSALESILSAFTPGRLEFARTAFGKPYLPAVPELKFNLSHSRGMALVGVAHQVEVGVDVERIRPLPQLQAIAERFFPPVKAAELAEVPEGEREREFFRRWTRLEAVLKARGVGLYGAGQENSADWFVQEIDAGEGFAAAVAVGGTAIQLVVHDFQSGHPIRPDGLGVR